MAIIPEKVLIRSDRILFPRESAPRPGEIWVSDGKIEAISQISSSSKGAEIWDWSGQGVLAPGIVDVHAHINEPGRTEWEGFATATNACAAGGTTTVVDMPLNSIPATVTLDALRTKCSAAQGKCAVDYALWGGIIPGNLEEIAPMIEAGVAGFKVFLVPSGVDEFPHVTRAELLEAMPLLARAKVPLIVHAELEGPVSPSRRGPGRGAQSYQSYLESRPEDWEVRAIRMMIELAGKTGCATHIVHLSAASALEDLRSAQARGVPITAETCPHYLSICSEEIPDGATHFKCAPPIRDRSNQARLWQGLESGVISFVTSDHSPCTPALKLRESGDFGKAWGGISSLQFTFPLVWSGARARGIGLTQVFEWLSRRPAKFAGLDSRKGSIEVGKDADFVLLAPEESFVLTEEMIRYKHPISPYLGRTLWGRVRKTVLRGELIHDFGAIPGGRRGQWLRRGA